MDEGQYITINKFLKVLIQDEENLRCQVRLFWENHDKKLDQEMLKLVSAEDVILTAGPDFLINEISNQLGTSHIQSSKVDLRKKEYHLSELWNYHFHYDKDNLRSEIFESN